MPTSEPINDSSKPIEFVQITLGHFWSLSLFKIPSLALSSFHVVAYMRKRNPRAIRRDLDFVPVYTSTYIEKLKYQASLKSRQISYNRKNIPRLETN